MYWCFLFLVRITVINMKYFKEPTTQQVYAYEDDGSQDKFILAGLIAISEEEAKEIVVKNKPQLTAEQVDRIRRTAYEKESDPLFFKAQRGEATLDEWKQKVAEIKARILI